MLPRVASFVTVVFIHLWPVLMIHFEYDLVSGLHIKGLLLLGEKGGGEGGGDSPYRRPPHKNRRRARNPIPCRHVHTPRGNPQQNVFVATRRTCAYVPLQASGEPLSSARTLSASDTSVIGTACRLRRSDSLRKNTNQMWQARTAGIE